MSVGFSPYPSADQQKRRGDSVLVFNEYMSAASEIYPRLYLGLERPGWPKSKGSL